MLFLIFVSYEHIEPGNFCRSLSFELHLPGRPERVITLFSDTRGISYEDLVLLKLMSRSINPYEPYLNKISVLGVSNVSVIVNYVR